MEPIEEKMVEHLGFMGSLGFTLEQLAAMTVEWTLHVESCWINRQAAMWGGGKRA